ncbi:hypothetical protein G7Y89_g4294 [Cudoniella acicularis]|uniref:Uncharacterized protein n=1 Tax=Cudoniella acicularis TaxID=354080 RepID=A0A8H4W555_9HELO|nr:hypothetical protein G7Y89_g4294 [Cudoniella acicularis]
MAEEKQLDTSVHQSIKLDIPGDEEYFLATFEKGDAEEMQKILSIDAVSDNLIAVPKPVSDAISRYTPFPMPTSGSRTNSKPPPSSSKSPPSPNAPKPSSPTNHPPISLSKSPSKSFATTKNSPAAVPSPATAKTKSN